MATPYARSAPIFTGADRDSGLFNPAVEESDDPARLEFSRARRQCVVRSIDVAVTAGPIALQIYRVDPAGFEILWRETTVAQSASYGGGQAGLMTLPTNPNRMPWSLKFVTDGPARIAVDYENGFTSN